MGLAAATRTCVLCLTRILRGVAIQVEDDRREEAAGDEHDGGEHEARAAPPREDGREEGETNYIVVTIPYRRCPECYVR